MRQRCGFWSPHRMLNSASSSKLILCEASKNDDSERNYDARATALMKQVIAEYLGHEMTMITLDIPPGGGSAPHRHPGHHTFGYVLEGAYKIKLDNGPEKTLTKGQTFYEAPDQLHAVSRNGSDTEPAKVVLVVILAECGKPSTVLPERLLLADTERDIAISKGSLK
jgi:quercetin dioxygenase-like cupin family protein